MDMQTSSKGGFISNFWIQTAALGILAAILIALAAKYIW